MVRRPAPAHSHQHEIVRPDDHGHPHADDHGHSHGSDQVIPIERRPTGDAVLFDIGDGVGALIVRLDAALAGTELPIEAIGEVGSAR